MQNLILPLLILVLIFVAFVLPARRRQRTMGELQQAVRPGVKVRTVGGLVGTVVALNDQEVILELAPGVETRWLRAAIGAVLSDDDEFVPGGTVLEGDADDEIEGETVDDDELVEADGDDDGEERAVEDEDAAEAAGDEPRRDDAGERDERAATAEGSDVAGAADVDAAEDEAAEDEDEPRRESALAAGGKKGRARTS